MYEEQPSKEFQEYCLEKWAEEYTMQNTGMPQAGLFLASCTALWSS